MGKPSGNGKKNNCHGNDRRVNWKHHKQVGYERWSVEPERFKKNIKQGDIKNKSWV